MFILSCSRREGVTRMSAFLMSSRVVLRWEALGDGCNFSLFVETWLGFFSTKTLALLSSDSQETLHNSFSVEGRCVLQKGLIISR